MVLTKLLLFLVLGCAKGYELCNDINDCESCNSMAFCHWCATGSNIQCHTIGSPNGCLWGSSCSTCSSLTNQGCHNCSAAFGCHWCKDNQCHAIGSVHGCVVGETCDPGDSRCGAAKDCESCDGIWGCHWCPSDQKCHAYGSPFGCVTGSDCNASNSTMSSKCKDQLSCSKCTSIIGCHWCSDKCHAIGSPFGCTFGFSCSSISDCARDKPAFVGYASLSTFAIFTTFLLVLTILSINYCCAWMIHRLKLDQESMIRINDQVYVELEELNPDSVFGEFSVASSSPEERRSRSSSKNSHSSLANLEQEQISTIYIFDRCCRIWAVLFSIIVITLAVFLTLYSPRGFDYNICTKQFEWKSIFKGAESLGLRGDYEVLVSFYNPNRLSVVLEQGSASFIYKEQTVGQWIATKPLFFEAGSITDVLMMISFRPSVSQTWSMLSDFRNNELYMDLKFDGIIQTSILGKSYNQNMQLISKQFHIGAEMPLDLCPIC